MDSGMNYRYAGIGSRDTPVAIQNEMNALATKLQEKGFILHSGGARGADDAFERGAGVRKQIFLPYDGFNGRKVDNQHFFLWTENAAKVAAHFHPKWNTLSKSSREFHSRNVHQVLGLDLKTSIDFIICWTSDGKESGGTGQAMRIARANHIPVYNLKNAPFNMNILELLG